MIAVFFKQKCRVAKTKRVGHSALKFGREGKCVRLIGIHPQDTGNGWSRINAVDMLPIVQVMGAKFILRLTINVVLERSCLTKIMSVRHGITTTGMMPVSQTRNLGGAAGAAGAGP